MYKFPSFGGVPARAGWFFDRVVAVSSSVAPPPRQAAPATPPQEGNFSLSVRRGLTFVKGMTHFPCTGVAFQFPSFGGVPARAGWFLRGAVPFFYSLPLRPHCLFHHLHLHTAIQGAAVVGSVGSNGAGFAVAG